MLRGAVAFATNSVSISLSVLFDASSFAGTLTLQFDTNSTLLERAVQDISTVIDIQATLPTNLIIFTGTDIRRLTDATV